MYYNIPNKLTLIRVFLTLILVLTFYMNCNITNYAVVMIFVFASITDYLDGVLARAWNMHSKFGKVLDPIADKLLIVSTLIMMLDRKIAPVLPTLLILSREILVSGIREYLAELRIKVSLPVKYLSKIKTATQMMAIITLLIGDDVICIPHSNYIGKIFIWVAAALTLVTGYNYLKQGIKNFY